MKETTPTTHRNSNTAIVVFSLAILLAMPHPASGQSAWIQGFGQFGTGQQSVAVAMSADGSVVAGYATTDGTVFSSQRPVLWENPGPAALVPGVPQAWVDAGFVRFNDISADGTVGIGVKDSIIGDGSFRWTSTGGFQAIPIRTAVGISADGTTIVGDSRNGKATLWTEAGGLYEFGPEGSDSDAYAANSDGTIVVGLSDSIAALWDLSGAPALTSLGTLTGYEVESRALSVSDDGSIVVGYSESATAGAAFRWTAASGMTNLGFLNQGDTTAQAQFVSGNGQYILGYSFGSGGDPGFIWTELAGMTSLSSYLTAGGVDLTGWSNLFATSITDDGRYLSGQGQRDGLYEGFVAQIVPEPSTYALVALAAAGLGAHVLRRRRK